MKVQYLIFIVENEQGISPRTLDDVEKEVREKKGDILYFIIQSSGGYPFSAVRIMNVLQNRFDKIFSVVPNQAMSAATLMALGTDEIYMDDKSTLGPLDLPIEHPKDGTTISALDVQNTITTLSSLSESIADNRYEFLRENKKLSKSEAAKYALQIATEFVKPIVSQIDPYHLQKSYRELRIGLFCAIDLLLTRMMKHNSDKAIKTARDLVNNYPSHDYAINAFEAENVLGLTIKKLKYLKVWDNLRGEYEKYKDRDYFIKYGEIEIPEQQELKITTHLNNQDERENDNDGSSTTK